MPKPTPVERVEILEEKVGALEELPARVAAVESQLVQLRDEMRAEFSAVRQQLGTCSTRDETGTLGATLRSEMAALGSQLRDEMAVLGSQLRDEMAALGAQLRNETALLGSELRGEMAVLGTALRDEIRAGDEETRRFMRVLHEDLVGRIALLQEGSVRKRKRRR